MGKINKILLCGHAGVGKSAIIEQLLYGNHVVESVCLDCGHLFYILSGEDHVVYSNSRRLELSFCRVAGTLRFVL